jgi:hypothetical protein
MSLHFQLGILMFLTDIYVVLMIWAVSIMGSMMQFLRSTLVSIKHQGAFSMSALYQNQVGPNAKNSYILLVNLGVLTAEQKCNIWR